MSILIFLVILVVLVVVHEFGHFITAKLAGIRVEEFGVGFPPRLWGKKIGETRYSINALPFGGFVRIFGEQPQDVEKEPQLRERSFSAKPKYIQAMVLVAGVFFNLVFAWILLSTGFLVGLPTSVDEAHLSSVVNPRLIVTEIVPNSPAAEAGLISGDEPKKVIAGTDSTLLFLPSDLPTFVNAHKGETLTLTVLRSGTEVELSIAPKAGVIPGEPERIAIGVVAETVGLQKFGIIQSFAEGAKLTWRVLVEVLSGLWHLLSGAFTGTASIKEITGPVGIVGAVGTATELGFIYLITFSAFISLNLAVVNLLPLPALDGGRLFFLLIEAIKGSPIRPKFTQIANSIGFALLILLMIVVTFNDIARLVG